MKQKRIIDLSPHDRAALGKKAGLRAIQKAKDHGLPLTGINEKGDIVKTEILKDRTARYPFSTDSNLDASEIPEGFFDDSPPAALSKRRITPRLRTQTDRNEESA